MSTVDYTRYTRIIHCRPCYNVYILHMCISKMQCFLTFFGFWTSWIDPWKPPITAFGERRPTPKPTDPVIRIWICRPGSGWLHKFIGIFLQRWNYHKDPISFSQKYEPNCGKIPHLAILKNSFKNFIDPDSDAICDFQLTIVGGEHCVSRSSVRLSVR